MVHIFDCKIICPLNFSDATGSLRQFFNFIFPLTLTIKNSNSQKRIYVSFEGYSEFFFSFKLFIWICWRVSIDMGITGPIICRYIITLATFSDLNCETYENVFNWRVGCSICKCSLKLRFEMVFSQLVDSGRGRWTISLCFYHLGLCREKVYPLRVDVQSFQIYTLSRALPLKEKR